MAFKIEKASKEDLSEMALIFVRAVAPDPSWQAIYGPICTFEGKCTLMEYILAPRLNAGIDLGACVQWKVVNENGYVVL
jgi:hypothetical protein